MRQEADFFGDVELDLVFVAKRLREALQVEKLLTDSVIDYFVEPDTYTGGFLFRREVVGAFFYVRPVDSSHTRQVLEDGRFRPYQPETE